MEIVNKLWLVTKRSWPHKLKSVLEVVRWRFYYNANQQERFQRERGEVC